MLNPLNRIWLKFGLLLHRVVNPVIMALLFYGTVLPTGLIARAMGKDLLRLKREPNADSYWIVRAPPGPSPGRTPARLALAEGGAGGPALCFVGLVVRRAARDRAVRCAS